MNKIIFDIETKPQDNLNLQEFWEEAMASVPKNYKDESKINEKAEKIMNDLIGKAALSAITGEIVAIGLADTETQEFEFIEGDEKSILEQFFKRIAPSNNTLSHYLVGFNSKAFDIPFIVQRAWANGVQIPHGLLTESGFYAKRPSELNIDLMEAFNLGSKGFVSLDKVAKFFKVGAKIGNGAEFWELYKTNKKEAYAYLKNDVAITYGIYRKMYNI